MTRQRTNAEAELSVQCTCTACPLVCDDILIGDDAVQHACGRGRAALLAASERERADAATIHRHAIDRAAEMLVAARRVLVTGLAHATLEAIAVACDLAEALGAAIDDGLPESSSVAGPTIARAGEVTGAWEELRDRADLVLFWFCDPSSSHPRFIERFVSPALADGRQRRTIAVGPDAIMPEDANHRRLHLPCHLSLEAGRLLQLRLSGRHSPSDDAPLFASCIALEEAIRAAQCVVFVTADADPSGLDAWAIVHLVRTIAHEKPAFQTTLTGGFAGAEPASWGANIAGARAVCTWRYGAAGAIPRADRTGARFLPAEADSRRLLDRGEVDAVLALGRMPEACERAIAVRGAAISLVRICDQVSQVMRTTNPVVQIPCASGTIATTGTVLREDGRRVVLIPHLTSSAPHMRDVLVELLDAVRRSPAASSDEGRS